MTKCGKYRDPNYSLHYRLKNRDKFNNYSKNWNAKKRLEDPEFQNKINERARNYYQENKEWINKRAKLKRDGHNPPDKRHLNGKNKIKHLSKCSHKKTVKDNKEKVDDAILSVKQGSFLIDWTV